MKVTCKYFKNGECTHQKAPKKSWFQELIRRCNCILYKNTDIRIYDCALREEIPVKEPEK